MPGAGRLRDVSRCYPHGALGPSVTCSPDVIVNDRGALRVGDRGTYPCPCAAWRAVDGAPGVYVNGRRLHRLQDGDDKGQLASASEDVSVGDLVGEDGKRTPVTWVALTLVTAGTRAPHAGLRVKITHAGKEYTGVTDEIGQLIVDGLPLQPPEVRIHVLEDVKEPFYRGEEVPPEEEEPQGTGGFDDYAFLLAGEARETSEASASRPEAHRARGQAFLSRGEEDAARASLREALAGYVARGERGSARDVQRLLAGLGGSTP